MHTCELLFVAKVIVMLLTLLTGLVFDMLLLNNDVFQVELAKINEGLELFKNEDHPQYQLIKARKLFFQFYR